MLRLRFRRIIGDRSCEEHYRRSNSTSGRVAVSFVGAALVPVDRLSKRPDDTRTRRRSSTR